MGARFIDGRRFGLVLTILALLAGCDRSSSQSSEKTTASSTDRSQRIARAVDQIRQLKLVEAHDELKKLEVDYSQDEEIRQLHYQLSRVIAGAATSTTNVSRRPLPYEKLPGENKTDLAIIEQAMRDIAAQSNPVPLATRTLTDVMAFMHANPDYLPGWLMQAQLALLLDAEVEGRIAGKNLMALGVTKSGSTNVFKLMVRAEKKGWLPKPEQLTHK